jgi:hypothetical protein
MLIKSKNITVLTIYPSFGESDYQKQLKKWKRRINRIKRGQVVYESLESLEQK